MTRSRTRSADVRGALVEAAVAVLERDGLPGLTVRAVATEAGVAPMGVYNHLTGKTGLLLAVLQRGFDGLRAAIDAPVSESPGDRLLSAGRGYRRFALANPVTYTLMFGPLDPSLDRDQLAEHGAPTFQTLVQLVIGAQAAGSLRAGVPEQLALQIWSSVHGWVSLELAGPEQMPEQAEPLYEGLLGMVLRGLAP